MILYGTELINKIRAEFDNAKTRIWIMVPFIGEWNAVKKIMGTKWIGEISLDMKIITDTRNDGFINAETIKQFLFKADVKTLPGLHAKIYIIDNNVFITSANLTGTAFSKRYEICHYYKLTGDDDIIKVFNDWWRKAKKVENTWQPSARKVGQPDAEIGHSAGLKKLWNLPIGAVVVRNFQEYPDNLLSYKNLWEVYASDGERLQPILTKYQEMDSFLNYLFHEHPRKPSAKYLEGKYRRLSDHQQALEVNKYKSQFKAWLIDNDSYSDYRADVINFIQTKLNRIAITKLKREDLRTIIESLHTMKSLPLNRYRFLKSEENQLRDIRAAFNILLHDDRPIEERMELCNQKLRFFGKSSIRELVSWYYPDTFPIINRNTNSGLKFLGYNVIVY